MRVSTNGHTWKQVRKLLIYIWKIESNSSRYHRIYKTINALFANLFFLREIIETSIVKEKCPNNYFNFTFIMKNSEYLIAHSGSPNLCSSETTICLTYKIKIIEILLTSKMEPQKILIHCKGGYSLMQFINCTSRKIA